MAFLAIWLRWKVRTTGVKKTFAALAVLVISTGSLSHEAKEIFLAPWSQKVKDNGFEDGVMMVEEMRLGIESRGTELHGMDRTVLMRALRLLENEGKAAIFKGTSADDEGSTCLVNPQQSSLVSFGVGFDPYSFLVLPSILYLEKTTATLFCPQQA